MSHPSPHAGLSTRAQRLMLDCLILALLGTGGAIAAAIVYPDAFSLRSHSPGCTFVARPEYVMQTIQKIATGIFTETGRWPESIEAMVNARDSSGKALMNSLDEFPKDLWGHPYRYELLKDAVRITCLGSDGAAGGEGEAADLVVPEERS